MCCAEAAYTSGQEGASPPFLGTGRGSVWDKGRHSHSILTDCTSIQCFSPSSYDHEGRLTNVTRPTGVVTSLHREMEKSITIDIENSNRDDDVSVITNLSSVEASYTVVQGKPQPSISPPDARRPRTQPSPEGRAP